MRRSPLARFFSCPFDRSFSLVASAQQVLTLSPRCLLRVPRSSSSSTLPLAFPPTLPNLRSFCVSKNQLDQLHSWGVPCHGVYLPIAWTHGAAWSEPVVSRRTDVRRMLAAPLWDEGEPLRTDADRRTLLLFVGRWNEEKRLDILARCIPDSCVLCIVGDGPEPFGSTVESLHDPQGTGIVVRRGFLPREKLVDYYQAADFVVSASNFETFGNMSYEANLCGTRSLLHPSGGHLSQIAVRRGGGGADDSDDDGDDDCDDSTPQHLRFGVNGAYVDFDDVRGPEAVKIRVDAAVAAVRALPVHKASRGAAGDRDAVRAAIRKSIVRSGGGLEIGEAVGRTLLSFETHGCVYRAARRLWTLVMALVLIVLVLTPMWGAVWTLVCVALAQSRSLSLSLSLSFSLYISLSTSLHLSLSLSLSFFLSFFLSSIKHCAHTHARRLY